MRGLFITGTDTGVGKTFIACGLIRVARVSGLKVFAFKPIETGVTGEWGEDQLALAAAAADVPRGTYRFKLPAAPWVAARAEGVEIDLERIREEARGAMSGYDRVLVEAAGGWRVPINRTSDTSILARQAGLPVLVVARAGLGTINHTLLTLEAIAHDGLELAGVVLSARPDDEVQLVRSNAEQIEERSNVRPYVFPSLPEL